MAAALITLMCSGTLTDWRDIKHPIETPVVLDLDNKTIKAPNLVECGANSVRPCPLTEVTETYIRFTDGWKSVDGAIDRVSGEMTMTVWLGKEADHYDFTCKPAKPLF